MRFCAASDRALLVYFGEEIGLAPHGCVLRLLRVLQKARLPWLHNLQPAYCSLLITFDPCLMDHAEVESAVREYQERAAALRLSKPKTIEIPVCYGDEFGPDLEHVAKIHALSAEQVIAQHCWQTYHAYFLGFAPGFAYLGDLPEIIATPRLETPRQQVPAGSVGIAGRQTAIYPFTTPGGWHLIGRTPLCLFRADCDPMSLISIGDRVRFRRISREEYRKRMVA